ncbi:hypothetical protein TSTA_107760 [Talaromyces stipitatus ATCC 10500]|uniref:Uncharacterized protein n=1 Tax=Talaromyces stipitatus (strain ATCC 10500 / CBS 375.48 / QM 6759 / NRRL 1006) TaxID=441959 RepID=B8MU81_TALSN|nr:uncharacterized protein TSTA_107760 [Talaromyces stipitatus ATCC 10500]EED11585.1 hypothetical protein TSTA_107760 [Talaromyces stipitatus ATCC 10500]
MAENTFDFLVRKLETQESSKISPQIVNILQCLKQEEPFKNCDPFQEFVRKATGMATGHQELDAATEPRATLTKHQQQDVVPYKRQRTTESTVSSGISHYDDNHIQEQIVMPNEGQRTAKSAVSRGKSPDDDDDGQEQIKFIKRSKGSAMPANNLPDLIHRLPAAMTSSKQWKWERQLFKDNAMRFENGVDRTNCVHVFVPEDPSRDISITLIVGYDAGLGLIYEAGFIRA